MQGNTLTITIKANSASAQAALERVASAVDEMSDKADSSTKKASNGFEKLSAAAVAVGNIISRVVVKAFNTVASSVSNAVKRIDTMNQYPKVMSQFGVSADDAAASIKRIEASVKGLPTTLNSAVASVQQLYVVTQDLEKSEKLFQAVNDSAMIFAQGSVDAVERFQYAYSQSLSAAKIDAANFRQMNEAIPGLMAKVAQSMGVTQNELKEGLSDGSIAIDKFNDALIKLDTDGGAGMEAMQNTARVATGGIKTSFTNMQTAITRGMSSIIEAIGSDKIAEVTAGIGAAFESVLVSIGGVITFIAENGTVFGTLAAAIGGAAAAMVAFHTVTQVTSTIVAAYTTISGIATVATNLMSQGMGVAKATMLAFNAVMSANPIGLLIVAIGALVAAFVFLWNNVEGFRNFFIGVFTQIGNFVQTVVGNIIGFFQSIPGAVGAVVEKVVGFFSGIGKKIGEFIGGAIKGVINGALGLIEGFLNAPINIINGALGLINLLPGVDIPMIPKIQLPRMEEGGVLGGSSYIGDKQMFMGNTGEMVINRQDQAALFNAIKSGEFGGGGVVIEDGAIRVEYHATGEGSEVDAKNIARSIVRELVSQGLKPDLANVGALR